MGARVRATPEARMGLIAFGAAAGAAGGLVLVVGKRSISLASALAGAVIGVFVGFVEREVYPGMPDSKLTSYWVWCGSLAVVFFVVGLFLAVIFKKKPPSE